MDSEQAIYLPKERKCSKFSSKVSSGSPLLEDWIEEVESCIGGDTCLSWTKPCLFMIIQRGRLELKLSLGLGRLKRIPLRYLQFCVNCIVLPPM